MADSPPKPLENFRIEVTTDNDDILIIGPADRHIEARYDEVIFSFRVKDEARDGTLHIGLNVTRHDPGIDTPVYILRSRLRHMVSSAFWRRAGFGAIIGLGLFGTQAVTLFATDKLSGTTFILALTFALLAGMGAAFQFKTKV